MSYDLFTLEKEINIICLQADVFPDGVADAFDRLKQKIVSTPDRTFYGVSRRDKTGNIIYKAGVTQIRPMEAEKLDCEEFRIRKGRYISFMVLGFKLHISLIADTFRQMLKDPPGRSEGLLRRNLRRTSRRAVYGNRSMEATS